MGLEQLDQTLNFFGEKHNTELNLPEEGEQNTEVTN